MKNNTANKNNKIINMKKIIFLFPFFFIKSLIAQVDDKTGLDNLLQTGAISVTIGGDFIVTGSFPALITERVDQFVSRVHKESSERILANITGPTQLEELKKKIDDFSLRGITLKRASGEIRILDLQKFRINGDFTNNPYLKNDDVIIFPDNDLERNFFTVEGAVNNPDRFFYVEGDNLQDALELARGINKAYENVDSVNIYRLSYDGQEMRVIECDINERTPLVRGDRIVVVADETQRKEFNVIVIGEVNRPGIIPITKNNTTVRKVIEDAGGFTENASLKKAKLFRGSSNIRFILENEFGMNLEKFNDYLRGWPNPYLSEYEKNTMLRMSNLTEADTIFFLADEQIRQMSNEASIDFSDVLNENSETASLKVESGDVIIIPTKATTVYVFGQVAHPGLVKYIEGKDFRYYLGAAGGVGELARSEDEIMIIKSESKAWLQADEHSHDIEPGDYIYVPKNPVRSFDYTLGKIATYLSIVGSVATIIILVVQLGK